MECLHPDVKINNTLDSFICPPTNDTLFDLSCSLSSFDQTNTSIEKETANGKSIADSFDLGVILENDTLTNHGGDGSSLFDTEWQHYFEPDSEPRFNNETTISFTEDEPVCSEYVDASLENFESNASRLLTESIKSTNTTSLLKQELNLKIQIERLKRGQSELFVTPEPPKKYELREDEVTKRNARLLQNRKSAYKSRVKSHIRFQEIEKKYDFAMVCNKALKKELAQVKNELEELTSELRLHSSLCITLQKEFEELPSSIKHKLK